MKDITTSLPHIFLPRMGWENVCLGVADPEAGRWGEMVPAPGNLPEGAAVIRGHFEAWQECWAIKNGRVVSKAYAAECTWWDDPTTCKVLVPEEGEHLFITGDCWTSVRQRRQHELPGDAEEAEARELRRAGAWRDAEEAEARAKAARKAASRARYKAIEAKANEAYGRKADLVLRAHIRWVTEDQVIDLVKLLTEAPKVARRLRHVPGGRKALRILETEFKAPAGDDYLREALARISGPRMDSALQIANLILD